MVWSLGIIGATLIAFILLYHLFQQQEQRQHQRQQERQQEQEKQRQEQEKRQLQQEREQHLLQQRQHLLQAHALVEQKSRELGEKVQQWFMIQPCPRCHEIEMVLLKVSPNARSVHYECLHCQKKMHASAGTPEAPRVIEARRELFDLVKEYQSNLDQFRNAKWEYHKQFGPLAIDEIPYLISDRVHFNAPAAPLPYEQTSRTPIPEAIRSEVWRRDGGRCVQCGSKQNLQFDHIIPVSQGGATSVANLQLLCQPCNGSKGKKIGFSRIRVGNFWPLIV